MGFMGKMVEIVEGIRLVGRGNIAEVLENGTANIEDVLKAVGELLRVGSMLLGTVNQDGDVAESCLSAIKMNLKDASRLLELLKGQKELKPNPPADPGATPVATPAAETETKEKQDEAEQPNA